MRAYSDLLEEYRQSVRPAVGRWRADLWFIRQVFGYMPSPIRFDLTHPDR